MKYSVWNNRERAWDHYEAPGALRDGVFAKAPALKASHAVGMTPEEAARALPLGARHVGRGPQPVGMIASRKGVLGMSVFGIELRTAALYGALIAGGVYLWRQMR